MRLAPLVPYNLFNYFMGITSVSIKNYLLGGTGMIPAIILWQGDGNNFVIDGAHRLSALIAWVNNDYGAGNQSISFFGTNMERGQVEKAKQVKKMIEDQIGSFEEISFNKETLFGIPGRLDCYKKGSIIYNEI